MLLLVCNGNNNNTNLFYFIINIQLLMPPTKTLNPQSTPPRQMNQHEIPSRPTHAKKQASLSHPQHPKTSLTPAKQKAAMARCERHSLGESVTRRSRVTHFSPRRITNYKKIVRARNKKLQNDTKIVGTNPPHSFLVS